MARFYVTTETCVLITAISFDQAEEIAARAARGESALPDDSDALTVQVTNIKRIAGSA